MKYKGSRVPNWVRHGTTAHDHNGVCVCVCVCARAHSVMSNSLRPRDCSPPSYSVGFSRQEYYCNELPFPTPSDLPNPGTEPLSPPLAGGLFTTESPGKPLVLFTWPKPVLSPKGIFKPYLYFISFHPTSFISFYPPNSQFS